MGHGVTRLSIGTGRTLLGLTAAALLLAGCSSNEGLGAQSPPAGTAATMAGIDSAATARATSSPAPPTTSTPALPTTRPARSAPASPGSSRPVTDRCHTSELSLAFGPVDAGAGQRHGTLILQNRSNRRCTILGFGGLQLLDAAKRPLPTTLTRVGQAPRLVRFGPRSDQIARQISYPVVPSGSTPCVTPVFAAVIPPDETAHLVARWPYGRVCGTIAGEAYGAATR